MANTFYQNKKAVSRGEALSIGKTNNQSVEEEKKKINLDKIQEEELKFWSDYNTDLLDKFEKFYHNAPFYKEPSKIISELIKPKKGDIWLDAGCGNLLMSKIIYDRSEGEIEKIYAIDFLLNAAVEEMEKMKELKRDETKKIKLMKVDLSKKTSFPDDFFDGITGINVFPFISEYEGKTGKEALRGILQEMSRILKKGGVLIWSGINSNASNFKGLLTNLGYVLNPLTFLETKTFPPLGALKCLKYTKVMIEKGKKGIYHLYSKEECNQILKSVGFEIVEWKNTFSGQGWVNKNRKL